MLLRICLLMLMMSAALLQGAIPPQMLNEGTATFESRHSGNTEIDCSRKYKHFDKESLQANLKRQIYDVLNYKLFIDLSDFLQRADTTQQLLENFTCTGKQIIILKIDSSGYNSFTLDAGEMAITNVKVSSKKTSGIFTFSTSDDLLRILSNKTLIKDDTLTITIDYRLDRNFRTGIYYFSRGKYQDATAVEPLVYTQGEPTFAHFWMPCNDYPYDKAISQISVKVPEGFIGVSNGILDSLVSENTGEFETSTFHWSHSSPVSTYLMTVAASKYSYFEQNYPRFSDNQDTVKIGNYMWDTDLNPPEGSVYNGKIALRNQPEMLRFYSSKFGEYSFEKYGTVAVEPYMYGGMEHQTLTTIHRSWLRGHAELGLAHEAAHHWIGDLITCASWNDIWINEGGATWFEALWSENITKNEDSYYNRMLSKANYYFEFSDSHQYPVYGVPENLVFKLTYITYNKAGWVFHMLSELTGREEFFNVMKDIFETNKFRTFTTEEFLAVLKSKITSPKMDLDLFFDQWIYGAGNPEYELAVTFNGSDGGKFNYDVFVNQVQEGEGYREFYEMPVDILFMDDSLNILATRTVYNNSRSQKFNFEFDFPVRNFIIDYRKILCKVSDIATTVDDNISLDEIILAPNPILSGGQISLFYSGEFEIIELKIYDLPGNLISSESSSNNHSLNNIQAPSAPGVYLLVIETNMGTIRKQLVVMQ